MRGEKQLANQIYTWLSDTSPGLSLLSSYRTGQRRPIFSISKSRVWYSKTLLFEELKKKNYHHQKFKKSDSDLIK